MRGLTVLVAFTFASFTSAKSSFGEACDTADSYLDSATWALVTDCDTQYYCAANNTCANKGCRRDVYPFGYNGVAYDDLPPLCPEGEFCPDEGDQCLTQAPSGGSCQKDRDDECQAPPDTKLYAGYLNTNGSICLNYTCYWANVTVGQTCVNENTVYTAYTAAGGTYAFIISRDNCANGLYCDGSSLQCIKTKELNAACTGNKECLSYNCDSSNKCGPAADEPLHPAPWVYVVIGVCILLLILGVMVSLWFFHRRHRKENQIKLEQYYREQIAYRQSIMSMSHAKNSLLSLPPNTPPNVAAQFVLGDDSAGYSTANENSALPPNMRRDSSAMFSESDSEVLLMPDQRHGNSRGLWHRGG